MEFLRGLLGIMRSALGGVLYHACCTAQQQLRIRTCSHFTRNCIHARESAQKMEDKRACNMCSDQYSGSTHAQQTLGRCRQATKWEKERHVAAHGTAPQCTNQVGLLRVSPNLVGGEITLCNHMR